MFLSSLAWKEELLCLYPPFPSNPDKALRYNPDERHGSGSKMRRSLAVSWLHLTALLTPSSHCRDAMMI